jgi:hypothetical protein
VVTPIGVDVLIYVFVKGFPHLVVVLLSVGCELLLHSQRSPAFILSSGSDIPPDEWWLRHLFILNN